MSALPRIAHVMTPKSWRGGEQQAVNLYQELHKKGLFQIIVCSKNSITERYCIDNKLNHVSLKRRLALDLSFAHKLKRLCEEHQIDIMHPHDSGAHTLGILSVDLFGNKAQMVLHRRVDFPISKSFFSRYKYNHPCIRKIICVSEAIRQIMLPDIKRKELLTVVYSGIDTEKFAGKGGQKLRTEFGISEKIPLVANVAAISQQKDYFTFVRAVALLVKQGLDAAFFIVGDGPQRQEIEAFAKQMGVEQQIIFTGFRHDIPEILPEFDLLLFSSETEGLGTTILDCFAAGVPVVSTNAGGIPELIQHMETGYLAEVKDFEGLAQGVKLAIEQPEMAKKWVDAGREKVKHFSRAATAERTLEVYKAIV